jgi:hypothetical protein
MRDKQIEEMGEYIAEFAYSKCSIATSCDGCKWHGNTNKKADCLDYLIAENLYNAGYRKKSEVAREIFEEIEDVINNIGYFDEIDFRSLKMKYESEGI